MYSTVCTRSTVCMYICIYVHVVYMYHGYVVWIHVICHTVCMYVCMYVVVHVYMSCASLHVDAGHTTCTGRFVYM
jgi:hypothetical protein